jgi:hypothetical protein
VSELCVESAQDSGKGQKRKMYQGFSASDDYRKASSFRFIFHWLRLLEKLVIDRKLGQNPVKCFLALFTIATTDQD